MPAASTRPRSRALRRRGAASLIASSRSLSSRRAPTPGSPGQRPECLRRVRCQEPPAQRPCGTPDSRLQGQQGVRSQRPLRNGSCRSDMQQRLQSQRAHMPGSPGKQRACLRRLRCQSAPALRAQRPTRQQRCDHAQLTLLEGSSTGTAVLNGRTLSACDPFCHAIFCIALSDHSGTVICPAPCNALTCRATAPCNKSPS